MVDGGDEKLGKEIAAVGRPADGIGEIAEQLVVARVFLAFQETMAMAASILDPEVVVLEVVLLGFELVIDGKGDSVVGTEGKRGDFVVDGTERVVEVLGAGGRGGKRINTEGTEEEAQRAQRKRSY